VGFNGSRAGCVGKLRRCETILLFGSLWHAWPAVVRSVSEAEYGVTDNEHNGHPDPLEKAEGNTPPHRMYGFGERRPTILCMVIRDVIARAPIKDITRQVGHHGQCQEGSKRPDNRQGFDAVNLLKGTGQQEGAVTRGRA
jgi:hypothetical protein